MGKRSKLKKHKVAEYGVVEVPVINGVAVLPDGRVIRGIQGDVLMVPVAPPVRINF